MKDSAGGAGVQRVTTEISPQRYLNDADLGVVIVSPGAITSSLIFSVEGYQDATLQALDISGGTGGPFVELAVTVGSESDGFTGGPVTQVIAAPGWLPVATWAAVTWSFARVRPVARRVRLRFRGTSAIVLDDVQLTMRLLLRGTPNRQRLKVSA